MTQSGYVLAGFETLATIFDNFIEGKRGRWQNNFTRQQISHFLASTCSGYLHSYGQNFHNKKKYDKYNMNEANLYKKCREMGIFDGCNLIVDSGGFQISIGKLTRRESDLLFKMYYDWLQQYSDVYDKAFILDIPPGPGCEIFHSFDDVYNLNLKSYRFAKEDLPEEVRKKIIYIHHFRTPKLWEIYTKILREYEMFDSFEYHGTGGIVANMASDMSIPCIIYVLPLIPLLNECKKYGKDHLNFHILGGANFRDVLYYELFTQAVKKKHNIDLNITYDSSGLYKQVMHARFIHVKDSLGHICKMNVKSNNLDYKFYKSVPERTVTECYQEILDNLAKKWGFKPISLDGVYDPDRDTFHEDVKAYSMLYVLNLYSEIQQEMREFSEKVYSIYDSGDHETFHKECLEATKILNQGKLTKKQKIKAYSISRSLDMLANLDEEFCQHIVTKFLAKDEFIGLDRKMEILNAL